MDSERVLRSQTIILRGDRIERIGEGSAVPIPADARIIDLAGRYVMPGLIDMHVHIVRDHLPSYVAYGVTSVRNMWGYPQLLNTIAEIESGTLHGPAIYSASPGINGPDPRWPYAVVLTDPTLAEAAVDQLVGDGWRFIKLYEALSPEVYNAVVDAARARRVKVVGHVAGDVGVMRALERSQDSIEHLSRFERVLSARSDFAEIDASRIPSFVNSVRQSGSWNCPTLYVYRVLAQRNRGGTIAQREIENRRRFVRTLHEAGAPLLVGTDAGFDTIEPGRSMFQEISDFVAAGIPPFEALADATRDAAVFLGEEGEIGTVAEGLRADLIVLSASPLENLGTLRVPDAVILRGKWIARSRARAARRP